MFGFPDEENGTHGKYRLLAELGQGGTANVYLAVARGLSGFNKLVVLKFLKAELAGEAEFRRMFLNEARLAARLNHPNVVQTYEVFEESGRPIIVMEYLEGAPLSRIVARSRQQGQPISLDMHLRIVCETLSGLHYSHELRDYDGKPLGVVHRDMTPQNVFVSFSGKISLLDFGIAKLSGSIAETQTGVLKGKLRYMPPEQILGEMVDRRTDIFAVGVLLWEALARQKMWRGVSDAAIMYNIVNGAIPSPRTVRPEVNEAVERICMKSLAFHPNDRYATAAELQSDLEDWLKGHTISNRSIGQFVNAIFREDRAKTRKLIESQLANVDAQGSISPALHDGTVQVPSLGEEAGKPSSERPTESERVPDSELPRRRRSHLIWVVFPFLLLGIIGGALVGHSIWKQAPNAEVPAADGPSAPTANAESSLGSAESTAAPAEEAPHIVLRVSAQPAKAKLYVDDEPLASNPFDGNVPSDAAPHSIRAEAPGFMTDQKTVTFEKDVEVALKLFPYKSYVRPPPAVRQASSDAGPAHSAEPPVNCNPPYFIDEDGIRRLKAKCLLPNE